MRGERRYQYRAVDKHGNPVGFLLTANGDLDAAKRFFLKMLADQPLLAPDRIGTDGAGTYPPLIAESRKAGLLPKRRSATSPSTYSRALRATTSGSRRTWPRVGGLRSFNTPRSTICAFEAMLWLRKGFGFAGTCTVCEQNRLLAVCFGLQKVNEI